MRFFTYIVVILCLASSCSSVVRSGKVMGLTTDYCRTAGGYNDTLTTRPERSPGEQDGILKQYLSEQEMFICKAAGIDNHLGRLLMGADDTVGQLVLLEKITGKLALLNTEIDAVAGELGCNVDRIGILTKYIEDENSAITKRLTIASVAIGAITTIAVAALNKDNNANVIAGVTGGLASAGFAAATISPKGRKVQLPLQSVLLMSIWYDKNKNNAFPSFVWALLNAENTDSSSGKSVLKNMKARWLEYQFSEKDKR
ncbi:MAG: hypothetical protein WDO19_15120 [Bacteroidota bacterium]